MPRALMEAFPVTSPAAESVLRTVLTAGGPTSRAAIGHRAGLSPAAVTKAIRPLLSAGLVVEHGPGIVGTAGVGRPVSLIAAEPAAAYFAGIKITADEIVAVCMDLAGQVRASEHVTVGSHAPDAIVDQVATAYRQLLAAPPVAAHRVRCVGVSVSGDVDRTGGRVRHSPFLGWRDVPLARLVGDATGTAAVIENDVRALTLAEQWWGLGVGATSLAVVTVGAGIGCGLLIDGRVLVGAHGVSGELGHLPLGDPEQTCYCGRRGCVETVASAGAVLRRIGAVTGRTPSSLAEAGALARTGAPAATEAFVAAGRVIGLAVASVVNLVGPERVVITGEGVPAFEPFLDEIRRTFAEHAFGAAARAEIAARPLPFAEWARGAATVALDGAILASRGRRNG
jgi:predicted NBD/HSP70 family sugar kinase